MRFFSCADTAFLVNNLPKPVEVHSGSAVPGASFVFGGLAKAYRGLDLCSLGSTAGSGAATLAVISTSDRCLDYGPFAG